MNQDFLALRMQDILRDFQADNVVGHVPVDLLPFDRQPIRGVENADDFFITLQTQSTQEDGGKEFPFPVDSDVEDILRRFVLELDPGTAIRNDLPKEVALAGCGLEKHPRAAVQLTDD